jgi:ribosomal protein S18 acetylase RimI-like enzyme
MTTTKDYALLTNQNNDMEDRLSLQEQKDGESCTENEQQHQQYSIPNNTENDNNTIKTGYIGMLAVMEKYRRRGIGQALVQRILRRMKAAHCLSVTLETEVTNITAQKLYQQQFGFIREEMLCKYYLNWNDAYRLRLWFV